jgi:transposase-like protein
MKVKRLRRKHTREFKLQCCRQAATGEKRPAQICREHNLSKSVLLRWRKEYEARGETAFTEKQPGAQDAGGGAPEDYAGGGHVAGWHRLQLLPGASHSQAPM